MDSKPELIYEKTLKQGVFKVYSDKPGFEFESVLQTHSNIIISTESNHSNKEADGLFFLKGKECTLAIKTADCLPIVIEGEKGCAFIHAGWQGLAKKILNQPQLQTLKPAHAFIGPSISVHHYEVQEDFKSHFPNSACFKQNKQKLYFDLKSQAKLILEQEFSGIKVSDSGICTFETNEFHSYRRNKTESRNWNVYQPWLL